MEEWLNTTTCPVELGDGRALVVDARRDLRAVQAAADERGLTVPHTADTHLHAIGASTGGSMIVSDAARTDLLVPDRWTCRTGRPLASGS